MAKLKGALTVIGIANLKAREKPFEVPDGDGLYVTVRPNGSKSFNMRFRFGGKARNLTIGPVAVGLGKARELALEARVEVARGNDPAAQKAEAKSIAKAPKRTARDLVEDVVRSFVEVYARGPDEENPNTRDWRETERLLKKHVVSGWQGRRLAELRRADVHDLLDRIVDRGAPIGANRVFAQLRKMCGWAVSRGIIEHNPCDGIKPPTPEKGRARERVLDARELALVWRAADELGYPFCPLLKMLMLTGQRRSEVAEMEWPEVNFAKAEWIIPTARSKNRVAHTVQLPPAAVELIQGLPRIGSTTGPIFTTTGRTPVSGFSVAKKRLDRTITDLNRGIELAPWILHDIRRSVATHMAEIGVSLPVIEKILNHVSGSFAGVAGIYQRHDFSREKRAALLAWANRLEVMVNGNPAANIVALADKRA
jgi:integrase